MAATRGLSLDTESQKLLDLSIMWLQKVTNLWCNSEAKFLSYYTNHNTNAKILMMLNLILTDPHDAFVCRHFVTLYETIRGQNLEL